MGNPQQLVQKLWDYCNILRNDGPSYDDYVEPLTFSRKIKNGPSRMTIALANCDVVACVGSRNRAVNADPVAITL